MIVPRLPTILVAVMCVAATAATAAAAAATLRPFATLSGPTVAVSDLWDDAGPAAATVLGPAPGPGERIVVEAAQLAGIARQFGVAWTQGADAARSILERPGVLLPAAAAAAAVRGWLLASGAPEGDIELTGFVSPLVAPDAAARIAVEHCAWEPTFGRFDATLVITGRAMAAIRARASGRLVAVTPALVARRPLAAGTLLSEADVGPAQIPRERLRGAPATAWSQVGGRLLRRALALGEPLLLADTAPPPLVGKGEHVAITIAAAGVALSAGGEALQAGTLGERIAVRNPASRAVLLAVVTGPAQVRIEPGSLPLRTGAANGPVSGPAGGPGSLSGSGSARDVR